MAQPWYKKLHWQIITGLVLGLVFGIVAAAQGWSAFTSAWIAPWGQIFLRLLLLIAVPLVLASLITGVASLSDMKKLSRIGGKTIAIYMATTVVALIIGLVLVNVMKPGASVPQDMREKLETTFAEQAESGM
ncbi:MAG: dicarboxylate/amino acid:cation symporter, partial [Rhodothermales bacterium]